MLDGNCSLVLSYNRQFLSTITQHLHSETRQGGQQRRQEPDTHRKNFLRPFCKVHKKFTIYPSPIYLTVVVVVVVVVVILFPEEYTKHMHNIITVISQNVLIIRTNEEQGEK